MASSNNVELEAARFLHKLIQDSKDEPAKLATKHHVILQHMKSSGKENSMPYQVISRAMETVISQHGLDTEALKPSRLPLTGGPQIGSSSQAVGSAKDSRVGLAENEASKMDPFTSGRPPIAPTGGAPDYYQGSVAQRKQNDGIQWDWMEGIPHQTFRRVSILALTQVQPPEKKIDVFQNQKATWTVVD